MKSFRISTLRVKNGCPEVVESQALTLISRLEEHKLQQVEELRSWPWTKHGGIIWLTMLACQTQAPGKWPCQQRRSFRRFPTKRCKAFSPHKMLMRNPCGTPSRKHSGTSTGGERHCISPRIGLSICLPVPNPQTTDEAGVMTLLCWSWIFSVLRSKMCTTMRCGRCSFALLERAGWPLYLADPRVEPCLFSGIVRVASARFAPLPSPSISAEWAPGFVQAIARALQTWPRYRLVRMTPTDWKQHVPNDQYPIPSEFCCLCPRFQDRAKGEAEVESREDYEDSLYQPSGGEKEDEHEHGHGVCAAKVEEEHPWETVRCDYDRRASHLKARARTLPARRKPGLSCGRAQWLLQQPSNVPNSLV